MVDQKSGRSNISASRAIGFTWQVFAAVAIPTFLFAFGGRWLDRRLDWSPLFTILGFLCALGSAGWLVYKLAKRFQKEWQDSSLLT